MTSVRMSTGTVVFFFCIHTERPRGHREFRKNVYSGLGLIKPLLFHTVCL